ncbi:MAG: response regulator transcription factor [Candidatus Krumholzibacteriota bacterium]|nr:response regulator transcription factor [Candidatus Krumholzibacteriota bacterium]
MKAIRVLLVEDHTIVRQGLKSLLEGKQMEIVGEAENGHAAVTLVRELSPDVVVMDIGLPRLGGIEAVRRIRKERPQTKIIMLTIHREESYLFKSLEAGADGYLAKDTAMEDLVAAINSVLNGKIYLSQNFPADTLEKFKKFQRSGKPVDEFSLLTNREKEILQLIAEGYTSRKIGDTLFISIKTVENHRANIMNKLDIHETAGLVRYAIQIGLVDRI